MTLGDWTPAGLVVKQGILPWKHSWEACHDCPGPRGSLDKPSGHASARESGWPVLAVERQKESLGHVGDDGRQRLRGYVKDLILAHPDSKATTIAVAAIHVVLSEEP